ncbi:MAG: YkvA family protein [Candidatus Limnocylindrales bacterium]
MRLARSLVADPATPRSVKVALTGLLGYLLSPIDLIPDFIPVLGSVDDLALSALVLRWGRTAGRYEEPGDLRGRRWSLRRRSRSHQAAPGGWVTVRSPSRAPGSAVRGRLCQLGRESLHEGPIPCRDMVNGRRVLGRSTDARLQPE